MKVKLMIALCLLAILTTGVSFADSTNVEPNLNYSIKVQHISDNEMYVNLDIANLVLPYNSSDVKIERKDYDNKVEFIVKSIETDEILTVFGEEIIKTEKNVYDAKSRTMGTRQERNLYRDFYQGPAKFRLNQPVTLYSSGSFRSITGAGKATLNKTGGDFSFSGVSLRNTWKGQESVKIQTDAMFTITIKTKGGAAGDYSPEKLRKAGYNVSTSDRINYTAVFSPSNRIGFIYDVYNGYTTVK